MDDETQKIKDCISNYGIEAILKAYSEENCFSEIVDCLVTLIQTKLNALASIEAVLNKMKGHG